MIDPVANNSTNVLDLQNPNNFTMFYVEAMDMIVSLMKELQKHHINIEPSVQRLTDNFSLNNVFFFLNYIITSSELPELIQNMAIDYYNELSQYAANNDLIAHQITFI
jgi:hypothetical protein